jgi:hypothetical protein
MGYMALNGRMIVNDKLGRIWYEAVMTYFIARKSSVGIVNFWADMS